MLRHLGSFGCPSALPAADRALAESRLSRPARSEGTGTGRCGTKAAASAAPLVQRDFSIVFKCQSPQHRRYPSSGSRAWEPPAPGTRGRPGAGELGSRVAGNRPYSGIPTALVRRVVAIRTRVRDGAARAAVGTKACTLKFRSSESGFRVVLPVSQVRR